MPTLRPELSLIVCFYDQQPWLRLILESIRQQTMRERFEVIFCDDGSSDSVFDEVRSATRAERFDIRYVWQPDVGHRLSRSRNNGIRLAQGRVLVFADGDSWLGPDFLQSHFRGHADESTLVCGPLSTVVAPTAAALPTPSPRWLDELGQRRSRENIKQREWMSSSRPWMACYGGNLSVPASAGLLFDEHFESWGSEDRDFGYRAIQMGLRPILLEQPNMIHLKAANTNWSQMTHHKIIQFLHNKKHLAAKYPDGAMEPSLLLIRHCHCDPQVQRWSIGPLRSSSIDEVFNEFDAWCRQQAVVSADLAPR